jgi:hypothetical protein
MEQGKRYKVTTDFHTMTVWTDLVNDNMVRGHVTSKDYPLVDTCVWTRHLANTWTWTEIEK